MLQAGRSLSLLSVVGLMLVSIFAPLRPILADSKDDTSAKSTAGTPKSNDKRPANLKPGNSPKLDKNAANGKVISAIKITPEREAKAIVFAGENHPELATLLESLKQNHPTEYRAAVVELDRIVERLALLKAKNAALHDSELAHWKMDSRIRLMAARLTMSDNPTLEAELKAAVREKVELTLADRQAERDRLQKRIEKLDQTIGDLSARLDEATEKELAAVKRSVQSSKPTAKTKPTKKGDAHAAAKPDERSAKEMIADENESGGKTAPKENKNK